MLFTRVFMFIGKFISKDQLFESKTQCLSFFLVESRTWESFDRGLCLQKKIVIKLVCLKSYQLISARTISGPVLTNIWSIFVDQYQTADQKKTELARLKRLRVESFMLNPPNEGGSATTATNRKQQTSTIASEDEDRRAASTSSDVSGERPRDRSLSDMRRDFQLGDVIQFVQNGLTVSYKLVIN
jgi:hypothetical protein